MKDLDLIMVCAFRYAIGRRTYITSTVSDFLLYHWDQLTKNMKKHIKEQIQKAIEDGEAGDQCDIDSWERILLIND